jgi:Arabinose-binding domain of AraC transcription regulator, N-term
MRVGLAPRASFRSVSLRFFEGKDIGIVTNYVGIARHLDRHQIECWVTALIRVCRKLARYPVKPSRVRFIHRRAGNFYEFAAFLNCDIEFGATVDEVVFPPSIADMRVVSADPYLNKLLIANSEEALSRRPAKPVPFREVDAWEVGSLQAEWRHQSDCGQISSTAPMPSCATLRAAAANSA